jgi:hypothetical protein
MFAGVADAVIFCRIRNIVRQLKQTLVSIAHGDGCPFLAEHDHIIFTIPEYHDIIQTAAKILDHVSDALVFFIMLVTDAVYRQIVASNKELLPLRYRSCEILRISDYKDSLFGYLTR